MKYLIIPLFLFSAPLFSDEATFPKNGKQATHDMTESDLISLMDEHDKEIYQKLTPEQKALMLKMATATKMQNNPMVMLQKGIDMMQEMLSKMEKIAKEKTPKNAT